MCILISVPCYAWEKVEQKRECFRFSVPYKMLFWHDTHTHTHYMDDFTMCHSTRRQREWAGDVGYMCTDEATWKNRGSFYPWLRSMKRTCQKTDLLRDWKFKSIVTLLIIGRNIRRQLPLLCNYRHIPCIFFFSLVWALADGMCFYNWLVPTKCWLRSLLTISGPPGVTGHQYWTGISSMDLLLDC